MVRHLLALFLTGGIALGAMAAGAAAQELSGTLKKIRDAGGIVLGYRESSFPFSYLAPGTSRIAAAGEPCEETAPRREGTAEPACVLGYSIDLCREIVDDVSAELGGMPIRIRYRRVTPEDRIPLLVAGEIDLECGSTTNNRARQREVAFSPVTFVTGTKLLVRRADAIRSHLDLRSKSIVVTAGTSNEAAMQRLNERQRLGWRILAAPDNDQAFHLFMEGRADAFATDDILLSGFIARNRAGDRLAVVGDFLSYDPYGLMYRKDDPAFAAVVDRTFAELAETRRILQIYGRWFLNRVPTGERLGRPMTPQLEAIFHNLGLPEE
jgi:glutamate/aspartate transport system substrate-binding protein